MSQLVFGNQSGVSLTTSADSMPRDLQPRHRAIMVSLLVIVATSFAPLLWEHLRNLAALEHHKHFPLIIGAVIYLLWKRWPRTYKGVAALAIDEFDEIEITSARDWPRWGSRLLTALLWASLVGLTIAVLLHSPWTATVMGIGAVTACVLTAAGSRVVMPFELIESNTDLPDNSRSVRPTEIVCNTLRVLFPVCGLLVLLMPLPFGWDDRFVQRMQRITSDLASRILDLLEIKHLMAGNTLELIGQTLFVDRACSGANGLLAMIAFSMFLVVLLRMSWIVVVPQLILTTAWVILVNALRIVVITIAYVRFGSDLSRGWSHDALSFAILPLTILMVYGTLVWLHWLTSPISTPHVLPAVLFNWLFHCRWSDLFPFVKPVIRIHADDALPAMATKNRNSTPTKLGHDSGDLNSSGGSFSADQSLPNRKCLFLSVDRATCVGAILLALVAIGLQAVLFARGEPAVSIHESSFDDLSENSMPAQFNDWIRIRFETSKRQMGDDRGKISKSWIYSTGGVPNWPVVVSLDYPFLGWHELGQCYRAVGWQETGREVIRGSAGQPQAAFISLRKPTGEHGSLWFALVDAYGGRVAPLEGSGGIRDRLQGSLIRHGLIPTTFQIQLFIQSEIPLPPRELSSGPTQLEEAIRILVESPTTSADPNR